MKTRTVWELYGVPIGWIGEGVYGLRPEGWKGKPCRWVGLETYDDVAEALKWGWTLTWARREDTEDTGVEYAPGENTNG